MTVVLSILAFVFSLAALWYAVDVSNRQENQSDDIGWQLNRILADVSTTQHRYSNKEQEQDSRLHFLEQALIGKANTIEAENEDGLDKAIKELQTDRRQNVRH